MDTRLILFLQYWNDPLYSIFYMSYCNYSLPAKNPLLELEPSTSLQMIPEKKPKCTKCFPLSNLTGMNLFCVSHTEKLRESLKDVFQEPHQYFF